MGLSLTNTHIHNLANLTKPQFKKTLTDMMKAKGYVKATEDDASVSFSLVFTKDRKWVTILGEDVNSSELAKSLSLQVLSVELVDSDFAELKLHSADGPADILMLGDPYMDEYPAAIPEKWQSILGENSWSQVEEIQSSDHTFAEEALTAFAQLIGLGENILLENDDIPEGAEILHFKKAKEKKLTLNAAFKQVFGPELEKQGFKPIKGSKNPIYLRVMTDEIINVISVENVTARSTARIGECAFEINGGVLSIYDSWWGQHFPYGGSTGNALIYRNRICRNTEDKTDFDLVIKNMDKLQDFIYIKEDPESLIKSMEYSLQVTKDYLLKEMNSVTDLESCIKFFMLFRNINIGYAFNEFGDVESGLNENGDESLMIIKADYRDDGMRELLGKYEEIQKRYRRRPIDKRVQAELKKKYDELDQYRIKTNKLRDKIFNTPELYEQAIEIADRVKEENIEVLRKHGIEM